MNKKVAVIGAGQIFQQAHLPILRFEKDIITCVVEPSDEAYRVIAKIYPEAKRLNSVSSLKKSEVDCAIISTPNALHYEATKLLLEKRIPVLCEKPLGINKKEADELVRLSKKTGVALQVGYYRRFHENSSEIKRIIKTESLGKLKSVVCIGGHVDDRSGPPSMYRKEMAGGGTVIDIGTHQLDRLIDWLGELKVVDYADDDYGSGIEANAVFRLKASVGKNEIPVFVKMSRTIPLGYLTFLEFDRGVVCATMNDGHYFEVLSNTLDVNSPRKTPSAIFNLAPKKEFLYYFLLQWREFLSQVDGGTETLSSLDDARLTTNLIDQCYKNKKKMNSNWEREAGLL